MRGPFGQTQVFVNMRRTAKQRFDALVDNYQEQVRDLISKHVQVIKEAFDIVRTDNASHENEVDLEFRGCVEEGIRKAKNEIRRLRVTIKETENASAVGGRVLDEA
jgi:hypothetical protein